MKKFVYSMQSILNIKQKLEEQEKNNYALTMARLNAETEKLERLSKKRDDFLEQCREQLQTGPVNVYVMRQNRETLEWYKDNIRQQNILVRKAEQNVEAAYHKLRQATMERKGQEKLKEKAFEKYTAEFEAQERKEVDELVSFRYGNGKEIKSR